MNQLTIRLTSKLMMTKMPVTVLLPGAPKGESPTTYYVQRKRYRVLWLLHGATCDPEDFLLRDHLLRELEGHETMVVMPYALNSDFADHMEFAGGYPFARFFFEELMPFVYNSLPGSQKPEDNFIAGYSMGGAGALMLGLMHPEKFAAIAPLGASERDPSFLEGMEGLTGWRFREKALKSPASFPTEYGDPALGITLKEINMISRYDTVRAYIDSPECTGPRLEEAIRGGRLPEVYFCCGELDGCAPRCRRLVRRVEALGAKNVTLETLLGVDHGGSAQVIAHMLRHFGL